MIWQSAYNRLKLKPMNMCFHDRINWNRICHVISSGSEQVIEYFCWENLNVDSFLSAWVKWYVCISLGLLQTGGERLEQLKGPIRMN